jgi:hypothetical protein
MAKSRIEKLAQVLRGTKVRGKVPTERPGSRVQRRVFDTFERTAQAIFQQSLIGGAERTERHRDFEEMDQMPEISKALDIYADDSCTYSENGDVLEIRSEDESIVSELEELYYERLDIEFHLWQWIRNMCKYGDNFLLLDIVEKGGVLGAIQLPALEIDREEGYDGDPNSVRFRWTAQGNTTFENYQMSHFRILGDDRFLPYGRSILEPGRKIWKQLSMAEDAMLIYRITRAPERRVFYIDVGNVPPKDVETYILQARDKLKRTPLVEESTGRIDMRYNPASIDEDFFLPIRGDRGSRIETLPGGTNQSDIEDVEYIQNKMFIALGVPKSYLTAEEDLGGKGTLAQEDIKFARTIQRIQKIIISELAKIGLIHLYLKGYSEEQIYAFDLHLTNPSTVMEMMQLDLIEKRFQVASAMSESSLVDVNYIQKNVLALTDIEISKINANIIDDARKKGLLDQLEAGEDAMPFGNPAADGGGDEEEDEDPDEVAVRDKTFKPSERNPMQVPDPTGAKNGVPGAKDYSWNEAAAGDDDKTDSEIFALDLRRKRGKKKKRRDPLDRTITDIMKHDQKTRTLMEGLSKDDIGSDRKAIKRIDFSKLRDSDL